MGKVKNASGFEVDFDAAVNLMDDDLREKIHGAADTEQEFFAAYERAHEKKVRRAVGAVEGKSDMVRYPDCQRADRDCSACSLSSYNRDCHNGPISNLAFYRCSAGLSQSELAKKAGISVRVLQNYEQGARDLKKAAAETVLSLACALGKTVEDLIGEQHGKVD